MTASFNYPFWNTIALAPNGPEPLYDQIAGQLRMLVVAGAIPRGVRLPPTRKLSDELGVSRSTIVLAYARLKNEGYANGRTGAGTYIEKDLPEDLHRRTGEPPPPAPLRQPRLLAARGRALMGQSLPSERELGYDLSPLLPALDELPFADIRRSTAEYWGSEPWPQFSFSERLGLPALRQQIAKYLGEYEGVPCRPEQIAVVASTTQAFILLAQLLLDPGDGVVIEDPGYPTRTAAMAANGARILPQRVDQEGLCVDRFGPETQAARMVIASPTNQFPYGSTMSMERRLALLAWARDRSAWVIEYDYSSPIGINRQPLPSLLSLDADQRVIFIGNINRIFSPSLGLTYLVLPPDLVELFYRAKLVFSCYLPPPLQQMVADIMGRGVLAKHVRRMRLIYRERASILVDALRQALGDRLLIPDVTAGLHLTAHALGPLDDAAVTDAARQRGIDAPALSRYRLQDKTAKGFVFGFGNTAPERIAPAVRRFAEVMAATQG
jgi:GntR family transcriptional regulator/MocR family aminotransferase